MLLKLIPPIKVIIFSLLLLFIYWDSTLWKIAVNYLGENQQRVAYGLLSIVLLLTFTLIYFGLFNFLQSQLSKNRKSSFKNYPKSLLYILIGVFCFKLIIFGDLRINITKQNLENSIEVKLPKLKKGILKIYSIGQVKGSDGWYKTYQGFYILEDSKTNKQYIICSKVVSGKKLKQDIYNEYTGIDKLLLLKNKNIKTSQKGEVLKFLEHISLDKKTPIYSIKTDGVTMFFMQLLYWSVYLLVIIIIVFLITLSLPD